MTTNAQWFYLLNVENVEFIIYMLKTSGRFCVWTSSIFHLPLKQFQVPSQNEPEAFSTFDNFAVDNFD